MKTFLINLIKLYQKIPGRFHFTCKFYPTCSNYAMEAIETYGTVKGSFLALKRIIRCNPFSKGGYDPLKKENV